MRYIGPFFRMNSLSQEEISGQLFYLAKESVKTLVLNSKCGIMAQIKVSKKSSREENYLNNFSPLLCIYRKASPMFIHSKSSHGFDESTFKKEISPATNALLTLNLLELSDYYAYYDTDLRHVNSLENVYKYLAKQQLIFYSQNLRNTEGLFVTKKNTSEGNSKGFNLIDKDDKFKFSDQALMMDAYLLYAKQYPEDEISSDYLGFSLEILNVLTDYKTALYELSFEENILILHSLNVFYKHTKNENAKDLIMDLGDFLLTKFDEKDYFIDALDECALFSICLMDSYKLTHMLPFRECYTEINERFIALFNTDKNIFIKNADKKEVKYSASEINFYLLSLLIYSKQENKDQELRTQISGYYRKCYTGSGLLTSWPEAPTLDEVERYKNLSLKADDMLDETYFKMPAIPSPKSNGTAPVFVKNLTYSKKKDVLTANKISFDSSKNLLNFYFMIYCLKDTQKKIMGFTQKAVKDIKVAPVTTAEIVAPEPEIKPVTEAETVKTETLEPPKPSLQESLDLKPPEDEDKTAVIADIPSDEKQISGSASSKKSKKGKKK